ncbi:DUF6151 family protein [uncultured Roseovarius sp.]|uniref:DUF6151 family protein n=1 Tax=uncultured Roseovarius sp. TaxID=293344 RepID=UPI0026224BC6|nr:DUF6151 family protein [uncultured Roseovarius sp.]
MRGAAAGVFRHACRCGRTKMTIDVPAPSAGTRLRCYCGDCQTAAQLHDPDQDLLSPAGGTDIWHTTPDLISIDAGAETLKISRLSPRGGCRWYAGCCGTLMFSTARNLKIPFISVTLRQPELTGTDPLLGPVRCHAFTASARPDAKAPKADKGMRRVGTLALKRAFLAWLSGRSKANPLRGPDGAPIAPVEVISLEARKAARPDHLP